MANVTNNQQSQTQNNPPMSMANSPDMSQINPQLLSQLIAASSLNQSSNQPAMTLNNGATGNSQGQQLPMMSLPNGGIGNSQGQQMGAYQKGVQKALQEAGYAHTQQAVQMGVSPDHIQNHPLVTGQQNQTNPMQVLQQLLGNKQGQPTGTNQVNNPGILSPQNAFQNTSYNPQTGQIQEGGWVNRGLRGFTQGGPIGLLAGLLGPSLGSQMAATKEAQLLKAGQPAEIGLPQAQAQEAQGRGSYFKSASNQINKTLDGTIPLSQEQKATIFGSLNNLKMEQVSKLQDGLKNEVDTNSKELENLINKEPQSTKILEHQNWANKIANLHSRNQRASAMMSLTNDAMKNIQFTNPIKAASNNKTNIVQSIQEATQRAKSLGYSDDEIQTYLNGRK